MRLEINTKQLRPGLASISKCINASTVLPVLESFLIQVKDGVVSYTATDLETSAIITNKTDCKGDFKACIPARQFNHFISKSVSDSVFLEPLKENCFKLCSGEFSGKVQGDLPMNYPTIRNTERKNSINLKYETIAPHLLCALKHVSKDDLRPAMTGIYIHKEDNSLRIAATDAHSLYFNEIIKTNVDIGSFILPAASARLFLSLFKNKEFELYLDGVYIVFENEEAKIICRGIDARYPDYKTVIPKHDLDFYLKRKQLSALLQLSSEYVNKSTHQITLSVSKDKVDIVGGDVDFEFDFVFSIPNYNASREFDKFQFAINLSMLKKVVDSNKDEYIKIHHSTVPTKAVVFDDKFLIMPLMLNN